MPRNFTVALGQSLRVLELADKVCGALQTVVRAFVVARRHGEQANAAAEELFMRLCGGDRTAPMLLGSRGKQQERVLIRW